MIKITLQHLITKISGLPGGLEIPVLSIDENTFIVANARKPLILKDTDLKQTKGKYVIDLRSMELDFCYQGQKVPTEFEFPKDVFEARQEARRLKALKKDAIFIDRLVDPIRYFYIEGSKLRIRQGEKETISEMIEIIHNQKAVFAEGLELGHPYLRLPEEVIEAWEPVLKKEELQKLALLPAGKSLLNGLEYYALNMEIPDSLFTKIKPCFEYFGETWPMTGWLTCEPEKVEPMLEEFKTTFY